MELWQHLSLSLYCRFLIDLTENVKTGPSEVWGGERCFPSQKGRSSLSTHLLSCWGLPWGLSKPVLATKSCPLCCRSSSGLATLDSWAVHTQTRAQWLLPTSCCCAPWCCWQGHQQSASVFPPWPSQTKNTQHVLSPPLPIWWVLSPDEGTAIPHAQPMLAAGGQGQHRDVLKRVIFTFKGYNLHWSPELVCCWQVEPAVPVLYLCVCFFCPSSLPTWAGAAGEWKHEKVFEFFVYYFAFAHTNDFASGSSVCCDFVFCSVIYFHLKKIG